MSDVLAVTDHRRGTLREESFELLSAGRELADAMGGDLHAAVIGGDVAAFADELNRDGVDVVHTVDHGDTFNHDVYVQAGVQLVDTIDPTYVVAPNSVNGLDYVPAVANRLERALVTDIVDLTHDGDALVATREVYGGKVETTLGLLADDAVVSLRAGEWPAADAAGDATVKAFDVDVDEAAVGSSVTGYDEVGGGDVDITEAEVLVSVGRGIDEEENLDLIFDLADAMDATVSSSRPIVDAGWLKHDRQVGPSGKVVTPEVYVAIGISGAVQHVAGMKGSDTIVAINTDPNAPILDVADFAIHDDLFDVVPALIEKFE